MPRKPKSTSPAPPEKHRAPRRSSFAVALGDAERKLAAAIDRKRQAEKTVAEMVVEIPKLQGIIRALGGTPPANVTWLPPAAALPGSLGTPEWTPREIPDGAGSILVAPADATPKQAEAPDIDTLPGMDGDFQ